MSLPTWIPGYSDIQTSSSEPKARSMVHHDPSKAMLFKPTQIDILELLLYLGGSHLTIHLRNSRQTICKSALGLFPFPQYVLAYAEC